MGEVTEACAFSAKKPAVVRSPLRAVGAGCVGLQTVPASYYEAARVEGASSWQQFRYITLPAINPTLFMVVILSTIGGFSLFIEPYIMTDGGPLNSTLSAMLYIYKQAFGYYHMGYSATLSIFFAFIIMIVVGIQRRFIERDHE